ncbi:ParB/RepB/Spo0J family partition protein [Epidermidibacterium keratini]|uniref:ParB/RepB/Spo0J family partition protein n=1 Tax=Epidermidibacterium keratini TaxID=1891644 RepID=A0A7L4YTI5_9ACTN|nr:ParB/RepB/Spo0J family partition protein [Epidermidibacterium keratini]
MGGGAGKGHFWSALDNPPTVDPASAVTLPDIAPQPVPGQQEEATSTDTEATTAAAPAAEPESAADVSRETAASASEGRESANADSDADVSRETGDADAWTKVQDDSTDEPAGGEVSGAAVLIEIAPDDVVANPKNPRQVFDEDELAELAASVAEFGLLQPIVVRRREDGAHELVMGERRLRASRLAGLETIPAIVRRTEDEDMLRDALLENIHRVQLHPLEEAAAYQQLIDEFGVTHEQLAQRIKRSRPVISNTIRLLKLPVRVQNRVAAGVISGSHARALLALDSSEDQEVLAGRIVAEGLSVRATEEAVSLMGGESAPTRRSPRKRNFTAPALAGLADKLSDHFDTRALVQLGRTKGKIVVEFASVDDLERIVAMMAPHLTTERLREQVADEPREE